MEISTIWAMFYGNLVAMDRHPGKKHPLTLEELALIADKMLLEYHKRFGGGT